MTAVKISHTWLVRKKIVDFTFHPNNSLGIKASAKKYRTDRQSIYNWRNRIDRFEASIAHLPDEDAMVLRIKFMNSRTNMPQRELRTASAYFDQLHAYYQHWRQQGIGVLQRELAIQLNKIMNDGVATELSESDKHQLEMRVSRWLKRMGIVLRCATHVGQNIDFDQNVLEKFAIKTMDKIISHEILPSNIVNMDETNIYFDQQGRVTLHEKGAKTVSLITTGCSARCTVLLAVSASGEKLKPLIVFKGKPNSNSHNSVENELRTLGYPEEAVYCVQKKAWCDTRVFSLWVEKVWAPFCESRNNEKTMFIMDRHGTHVKCADLVKECNTIVVFIPAGYTSKLQVLDVGVNKPFKQHARGEYVMFLQNRNNPGQLPSRFDVANWIVRAWEQISVPTILNTWRKVGVIEAEDVPFVGMDDENYYALQNEQEDEIEFLTGGAFNEEGLQGPHDYPPGVTEETDEETDETEE
jgi:DDE superfamily endonuclease